MWQYLKPSPAHHLPTCVMPSVGIITSNLIEKEKASLPGVKKALGKYGPANVEDTTESGATDSKDDDDDIDLFGSDDEEVWHKLTYVCIIVLKRRLYSQNPWVLTLASLKVTCLLKFLTSYMMNKIKSPSFG